MKTTLMIFVLLLSLAGCRTAGVGGFLLEPVGDCRPTATAAPAPLTRDDLPAIIAACRPAPAPVAPAAPRKYIRTASVDGAKTSFKDADGTEHVIEGRKEILEVTLPEGVDFSDVRDEKLPAPTVDPVEVSNLRREVERMRAAAEAAQQAPAPAQPVQYLQPRAPRGMEYRDGMYVPSHR
jgi:hypothetical protein